MKLAFSTLGCPDWSFDDVIAAAKDLGYNGIEIRGIKNDIYVPRIKQFKAENIDLTKKRLSDLKLEIPCLTSSCLLHVAARKDDSIWEGEEYIDIAAELGTPYIRVMGDNGPEPEGNVDEGLVFETASRLAKYAEGKGVKLLIESNGFYAKSERLAKLIQSIGGNGIGALWDVHHPYRFFNEDPRTTFENLKPYICHVHYKDSLIEGGKLRYVITGQGDLPLREFTVLLANGKYGGYISLEWVKRWNLALEEPGIAFAYFIDYMKDILDQ